MLKYVPAMCFSIMTIHGAAALTQAAFVSLSLLQATGMRVQSANAQRLASSPSKHQVAWSNSSDCTLHLQESFGARSEKQVPNGASAVAGDKALASPGCAPHVHLLLMQSRPPPTCALPLCTRPDRAAEHAPVSVRKQQGSKHYHELALPGVLPFGPHLAAQ